MVKLMKVSRAERNQLNKEILQHWKKLNYSKYSFKRRSFYSKFMAFDAALNKWQHLFKKLIVGFRKMNIIFSFSVK